MNIMLVSIPENIDKYFFKRTRDIQLINTQLSLVKSDIPPQILITGRRGVGKTFLLRKILNDLDNDVLAVFVDLYKVFSRQNRKLSEEDVLKEMLISIADLGYGDTVSDFIKHFNLDISNSYHIFSKLVMELPQKIVDDNEDIKGFIIIIDDFQLLSNVENPEAFFWLLRSFSQKQFNVGYLFSAYDNPKFISSLNGYDGPFGGRLFEINIKHFTLSETKEYIEARSNNLRFTDNGFKRFYQYTYGIPLYINCLSSMLPNNIVCDEKIITDILYFNIDQLAVSWIYIWNSLTDGEKDLIRYLFENDGASRKMPENDLGYAKSSISRFITSLSNQGIVEFNKKVVISENMLKTWLKTKYENNGFYPV